MSALPSPDRLFPHVATAGRPRDSRLRPVRLVVGLPWHRLLHRLWLRPTHIRPLPGSPRRSLHSQVHRLWKNRPKVRPVRHHPMGPLGFLVRAALREVRAAHVPSLPVRAWRVLWCAVRAGAAGGSARGHVVGHRDGHRRVATIHGGESR